MQNIELHGKKNTVNDLINNGTKFKTHYVHLSDLKAVKTDDYKENRSAGNIKNLLSTGIHFDGKVFKPTQRFWTSFCSKIGIGTNVFNLYDHDEVLNRVVSRGKFSNTGNVRIIEDCKNNELLAITDPLKPVVDWKNMLDLIDKKGGYDVSYSDGIISSMHNLSADLAVKVGSEDHKQRIAVYTPIDGYGAPAVYLAMMRLACSNGMVAMSKAFKTSINIGKKDISADIEYSMERMFDSFSNDEGFDALIKRLNAARSSKLSVREYEQVSQFLSKIVPPRESGEQIKASPELAKFRSMAGNLNAKFGLSHLQQLSDKQMGLLETDMSIYEAINYLTEVNTHRLNTNNSTHVGIRNSINGWIGSLVSRPYDLEGVIDTTDVKNEYQDTYFSYA